MYLIDFFKRLTQKSNIPIIIYLVMNIFLIAFVILELFAVSGWMAILLGVVLYGVSLAIALSPLGEWILRLQTGCRKIKRMDQLQFLEPIFKEVYSKAKQQEPTIPDDVQLYINDDECPNAFATGRKTICVTEGLLHMPPAQIKATLGHEFGHLAHKDTDMILLVSVGNLIVNTIILGVRLVIEFFNLIFTFITGLFKGFDFGLSSLAKSLYHFMIVAIVSGLTWIWTKIGILLVMKSRRANEYEADKFSYELGYGDDLCALLDNVSGSKPKGLFANLVSTHPKNDDRINRLQELGTAYRRQYGKQ